MKISILAFTLLCSPHAASLNLYKNYVLKDSHVVPATWTQLHRADPDHVLNIRIGLKQNSFDELEKRLYEVSDPAHKLYAHHLSQQEVQRLVAPSNDALLVVHSWLERNEVSLTNIQHSPAKDWVSIPMPVSKAEYLLQTQYYAYEDEQGVKIIRTPQYSLPAALHGHIDVVQPTNYFGNPTAMRRPFRLSSDQPVSRINEHQLEHSEHVSPAHGRTDVQRVCNESAVSNQCLRTLYRTVDYVPQAPYLNEVAMTAFLKETANISDFHLFLSRFRPDASQDYTYNYTTINSGPNNQAPLPKQLLGLLDVEANLDSQTIGGFVYPTEMRVYSTGGKPPFNKDKFTPTDSNEPYLEWLTYLTSLEQLPHTISTSYGDDEQTVPYSYAKRVCEEFAQLGARGVSLFFASGDDGVGHNGTCVSNDGKKTRMFVPEFPASCPYITTVGGTRGFEPEVVAFDTANGYVSGSGLSNYFARPIYQDHAVSAYLASIGDLHAGLYNATGRAYPALSAQGYKYLIVYAGYNITVDGTSAATPCATSVFTLLNDALIAAGKKPLGFLNPRLYKDLHKGLNDVTMGSTWGCNT